MLGGTIKLGSMMEHAAAVYNDEGLHRVIFIAQYVGVFINKEFNKIEGNSRRRYDELPKRSAAKAVRLHPGASQTVLEDEKTAGLTFEAEKKDGNLWSKELIFVCKT